MKNTMKNIGKNPNLRIIQRTLVSKSQEPMGDVNVIKKLSKSMPLTDVCYTWHLKKLLRKGTKKY